MFLGNFFILFLQCFSFFLNSFFLIHFGFFFFSIGSFLQISESWLSDLRTKYKNTHWKKVCGKCKDSCLDGGLPSRVTFSPLGYFIQNSLFSWTGGFLWRRLTGPVPGGVSMASNILGVPIERGQLAFQFKPPWQCLCLLVQTPHLPSVGTKLPDISRAKEGSRRAV